MKLFSAKTAKNLLSGVGISLPMIAALASCHSGKENVITGNLPQNPSGSSFMPKASIYRMSGDCPELVPVNVAPSGDELISYPAPSDLLPGSEPLQLADGWWLDRRGISKNTRFTTYTYSQYRNLTEAPAPGQILQNLDPECRITDIRTLPMSLTEALQDTAAVNNIILHHPEKLTNVYFLPTFTPQN